MSASLDQGSSERAPTRAEVLERYVAMSLADVRKMLPAVVTKYDASTQKVDVKPLIKNAYLDEEDARQVESMPIVVSVPVLFLSAGQFVFACPIDTNTTGALIFSDRSMDKWLSGDGQEVDPEIDHEHGLSDAVFIPGLNPFGAALNNIPADHAVAGHTEGLMIHFYQNTLALGADVPTLTPPVNGVVLGAGIDPFTGSTYFALQNASSVVLAKKQ